MKKYLAKKIKKGIRRGHKAVRRVLITKRKTVRKAKRVVKSVRKIKAKDVFNFSSLAVKKPAIVVLIAALLVEGGVFVPRAQAYFGDVETSVANSMSASSLDIVLSPGGIYNSGLMYPTDATGTPFSLSNVGNLDYSYISKIELLGGNKTPCDYISVSATSTIGTATATFTSLIKDFITPTTTPSTTTPSVNVDWNFSFAVASNTPPTVWGKTCYFKWIYSAWQNNLSDPLTGFNDTEEKSGSIKIGKAVVLNEFLPNPAGVDTALKPNGEWVELYNNSNIPISLANWVIYDSVDTNELYITSSNTNTGTTTIAAHSWLVVYKDGDSDFNLNNDADSVRLYTGYPIASSTLVDTYTYTEEKPEGFSYARIPDGLGDWVDPVPTPGEPNVQSDADGMNEDTHVGEILPDATITPDTLLTDEFATSTPTSTPENLDNPSAETTGISSSSGGEVVPNATTTPEDVTTSTPEILPTEELNTASTSPTSTPASLASEPETNQSQEKITDPAEINPPAKLPTTEQAPAVEPEVPAKPEPQPQAEPAPAIMESENNQSNIQAPELAPVATEPPAPAEPTGGPNE